MKNLRVVLAGLVIATVIILLMSCAASKKASCPAYGQVETESRI